MAVEWPGFPGLEGEREGGRVAGPARPQILSRLPESVTWRMRVASSVVRTCASQTSIVVGDCALAKLSRAAVAHGLRQTDAFFRDVFWINPISYFFNTT